MPIEKIQLVLQIISVIGVPILTAFIAWITSSLRKTNQRIDDLREEVHEARYQDSLKMGDLKKDIAEIAVGQKHILDGQKRIHMQFDRMQTYLDQQKK